MIIPVFLTANIKVDVSEPIVLGVGHNDFHTCIKPRIDIGRCSKILWMIYNGFKMFKRSDVIVVSENVILDDQLKALRYIVEKETSNKLGIVSLHQYEYGSMMYRETSEIDLSSFAMTRTMFTILQKSITDELVFNKNIGEEELIRMFRDTEMNFFSIFPQKTS